MTVQIKICGISSPEIMDAAVDAGATHVGLVHFENSPRHVTFEQAYRLRMRVPESTKVVLLLVNADPIATAKAIDKVKPDVVQFHGNEKPEWVGLVREKLGLEVWKARGVKDLGTFQRAEAFRGKVDRILYDAPAQELPGGNGVTFRWDLLKKHRHTIPWGLAGGLTPDNVADAIAETGAELVDASSGLESAPGVKDVDKIAAFCEAARSL